MARMDEIKTRRSQWQRVAHHRRHQLGQARGWVCAYCLDGLRCGRCGTHDEYGPTRALERSVATADHIIPISRGGPDDLSNLVLACGGCNSSKGISARLTIAEEMGWGA